MSVVVHVPAGRRELPVLIAMHGWGEALKGPKRGARGWFDDYGLGRALQRLKSPPLTAEDFEGYVDPPRLARINESLAKRPFRGLVIVCPYTPRAMMGGFDSAEPLAAFLVDELLPRVRTETPALPQSGAVGIDGVSLGGRSALLVGFERPNSFGMIASLQAAFYPREVSAVVKRGKRALEVHPQLKLRLLTSSHDGYRGSNKHIAERLRAAGAVVRFDDIPGPHTYAFNRGPAVYEMLLMHDRALRGEPYLRAP